MSDFSPSQMPTLGDEGQQTSPPGRGQPAPPPRYPTGNSSGGGRPVLWVILGIATGCLLPVCAIAILCAGMGIGFGTFVNQIGQDDTGSGPAVGIIELTGPIISGEFATASEGNLRSQIEWMEDNNDVRAIVVRANSPGGDANVSDEIWQVLGETDKPVVVSVQGLCASGCLYIASGADEIMATRNSLVGSIGVISTFFNVEELLDNVGIEVDVIATGDSKDFGSLFRDMTPEERVFWEQQIEVVFENFIRVVANRPGSTLTEAEVRELATGQVWAAEEALNLGLIDNLGYESDAIERAAQLANMQTYRVIEYPYNFDFLRFFTEASAGLSGEGYFALPNTDDVLDSLQQPSIQYRYFGPYSAPVGREE